MKNLLTLLALFIATALSAQSGWLKPNGSKGMIYNGVQAINELYIPNRDTDFKPAAAGALLRRPEDGIIYASTGATNGPQWVKAVGGSSSGVPGAPDLWLGKGIAGSPYDSANGMFIDEAYLNTLYSQVGHKHPEYLASHSDPTYYIETPTITGTTGSQEVPNITGIKDSFLVVSGSAGAKILTINKGTPSTWAGINMPVVIYHKAQDKYLSYYGYVSGNSLVLTTPLVYAASSDTMHSVHDDYLGLHLTTYAYRALADLAIDVPKGYALKSNAYIFQPELNPFAVPFTFIGGLVRGGFISGTDVPSMAEISLASVIAPKLAKYNYSIYQGGKYGAGVSWTVDLGGKSGYLEANIALNKLSYNSGAGTSSGIARVIVDIDGKVDSVDVTAYNNQVIRFPFTNGQVGTLKIITGNAEVTAIEVNRIGWYIGAVDSTKIDFSGKGVVLGDSWTQFQNGHQDLTERMKQRLPNATIINNGRSGMTSAWGRYWFKQLVLDQHPKWVIIEFFTNDNNSSAGGTGWNFSSTYPFDVSKFDVPGNVTKEQWKENIDWMISQCLLNNIPIQPMIIDPAYGHNVLSDLGSQIATNKYFDVQSLSSATATVEQQITTPLIVADSVSSSSINTVSITGGSATVGGHFTVLSKEQNSGIAKGTVIGNQNTNTGGNAATFINGYDVNGNLVEVGHVDIFGKLQMPNTIGTTEDVQFANGVKLWAGVRTPQGYFAAPVGSLYTDKTNGYVYVKKTGTDTLGWAQIYPDTTTRSTAPLWSNEVYTSGTGWAMNDYTTPFIRMSINPTDSVPSLELNLPTHPVDNQTVKIFFGGTLASGTVINTFSVGAGAFTDHIHGTDTFLNVKATDVQEWQYNAALKLWFKQ